MADKELRKLNRRELLQMLLVQCEETERLQQELDEIKEQFDIMSESYERLKRKLDVKDQRLNEKDARIEELESESETLRLEAAELKRTGIAGPAAEAADRIGAIFKEAQQAAEEYLAGIRNGGGSRIGKDEAPEKPQLGLPVNGEKKMLPFEQGKIASFRKKQMQIYPGQAAPKALGTAESPEEIKTEFASLDIAAGDIYG